MEGLAAPIWGSIDVAIFDRCHVVVRLHAAPRAAMEPPRGQRGCSQIGPPNRRVSLAIGSTKALDHRWTVDVTEYVWIDGRCASCIVLVNLTVRQIPRSSSRASLKGQPHLQGRWHSNGRAHVLDRLDP